MAENSAISWTNHTYNPWIGCTRVSPGCAHCYAADSYAVKTKGVEWGPGKERVRTKTTHRDVRKWNRKAEAEAGYCARCGDDRGTHGRMRAGCAQFVTRPSPRVFCASLADWLDPEVPIEWLADLLALIAETPHLDWLMLTKRPHLWRERVEAVLNLPTPEGGYVTGSPEHERQCFARNMAAVWLSGDEPATGNVWVGTTVEDQKRADERIPALLEIPARIRFLSCEPLLEAVYIGHWLGDDATQEAEPNGIHWVIAGGESGAKARPMHPIWARSLRDQCQEAGVAFHFKQYGRWAPTGPESAPQAFVCLCGKSGPFTRDNVGFHRIDEDCPMGMQVLYGVGKKAAGRELDGRTWDEVPA